MLKKVAFVKMQNNFNQPATIRLTQDTDTSYTSTAR